MIRFNLIINAGRRPTREDSGMYKFNEPTVSKVLVLMVGEPSDHHNIVQRTCSNELKCITEIHKAYNILQYPLTHFQG